MGGDGGSIPKRKEVVKFKKQVKLGESIKQFDAKEKWIYCPLSYKQMTRPIMAGHWGHLMSKEGLLEYLIMLSQGRLQADHMQLDLHPVLDSMHGLKDARELKLKDNPNLANANSPEEKWNMGPFVCPITGLETDGNYKFVFSWRCGCVVSERAVKECDSGNLKDEKKCLVCEKSYMPWELITINPMGKDLKDNQSKFLFRKIYPQLKKTKKKEEGSSHQCEVSQSSESEISSSQDSSKDRDDDAPRQSTSKASNSQSRPSSSRSSNAKRDRSSDPHDQPSTSGTNSKRGKS